MSNMNFNCDVCGREVYGCTFVNGMKFCAKCYQETFGETEKDRKIADLQSQLAEKEKEFNWLHNKFAKFVEQHNQDKISFAVDVLEEIADCSNYINSKLDFECGSYVSEKAIRDKIKYLKGKKDE